MVSNFDLFLFDQTQVADTLSKQFCFKFVDIPYKITAKQFQIMHLNV